MQVFFTTPRSTSDTNSHGIDQIIRAVAELGHEVVSPEFKTHYSAQIGKLIASGLKPESAHNEFVRQAIMNCDVVMIECSVEDFRVGYETSLALTYHKPVLLLTSQLGYVSDINHPLLTAVSYDANNIGALVKSFLAEQMRRSSHELGISSSPTTTICNLNSSIIALGGPYADIVADTDSIPVADGLSFSNSIRILVGGKVTNGCVGLSRLGIGVELLGVVGSDMQGTSALAALSSEGVGTSAIACNTTMPTGTVIVIVDDRGKNAVIVNDGAIGQFKAGQCYSQVQLILEKSKPRFAYMSLEFPQEAIESFANACAAAGLVTLMDAAPAAHAHKLGRDLMDRIDILTMNCVEASEVLGAKIFDEESAIQELNNLPAHLISKTCIVTLGEQGCILKTPGYSESTFVPATSGVRVVDETGAGDSFRAGLLAALADGQPIEDACIFATQTAGFTVTGLGASSSMPTRQQLKDWLAKRT